MGLNEFLDKEETTSKELIRVDEGQLIVAEEIKNNLVNFELARKAIEKQEKDLKKNIETVMREYGITKYESNDKRLMITLGEDGITETIDKDKLFLEEPDIFRKYVKETSRKGSLRITAREDKDE